MTSNATLDYLENIHSRKMVTPNRLSLAERPQKSISNGRRKSFRKLYTLSPETEEPLSKRRRLSTVSTNATLGNASSLEESLSIVEKSTDEASPLLSVKQMQLSRLSRHRNTQVNAGTSNQKPLSCIPDFTRSNSDSSPDMRKIKTPVRNFTPPNRILSCVKSAVTPSSTKGTVTPSSSRSAVTPSTARIAVTPSTARIAVTPSSTKGTVTPSSSRSAVTPSTARIVVTPSTARIAVTPSSAKSTVTPTSARSAGTPNLPGYKTPTTNATTSYNDSPLSVKVLKSKHEALNALQNIMFSPQISGIKRLQSVEEKSNSNKITNHRLQVHDELPNTQPAMTVLMQGVTAFVDVRNGGDNRSEGVKSHLRELGAVVLDKFTKEATHVVFMDGLMSTYKKAMQWKIPLVSVLWIEACKEAMRRVPETLYPPHQMERYESPDPLKKYRRERSFQPDPDENLEAWLEKCKLRRRKKRLIVEEKENEEIPLPEVLQKRPAWLDGNLEQALRSIADVGPEYDEYINRTTSPPSSDEDSFGTPLAVRLMRKMRRAEEQNAGSKKKLDEPGMSKEEHVNKSVHLETPQRPIRLGGARKSICFSNNVTSDSEDEPIAPSPTEVNLSKAIQQCIQSCTTPPASSANNKLLTTGLKTCESMQPDENKLRESKSKSQTYKVNESVLDCAGKSTKESSSMEFTPNVGNGQLGDATKLSCDMTCSVSSSGVRSVAKRKLMPLTQPEVLEGDISETAPLSLCPYNLDSPQSRKRKRIKSPVTKKDSRRNGACHVNVSLRTKGGNSRNSLAPQRTTGVNSRNSLADFVLQTNTPKKDSSNVTTSLPTMVGTGLHTPELEMIAAVIEKLGGFTLVPKVVSSTTHVIAPGPRRTVNLLKGMIRGCWIVSQEWVLRSLEAGHWIEEEPFELTAFSPAVQENRVARLSFGPRYKIDIFKECGAMYVRRSSKPPKEDLEDLITLCGGQVVKSVHQAVLVVGKGVQRRHACCVQELWILDCITHNELKPFDRYLSEDTTTAVKSNETMVT